MKKSTKLILAVGSAVGATAAIYQGLYSQGKKMFDKFYSIKRREIDITSWLYQQPYQTLEIENKDGLKLQGYYLEKEGADFTFVIVHGYHSHAFRMSDYAEAFYTHFNCNIFLPDLRGHGKSDGQYVGYGWLDKEDIKEWVDLLAKKNTNQPIVLFGLSMGGGTINYLSDTKMPNVKVLIEDCGYSDLYDELDFSLKSNSKLPLFPFYHGLNSKVKQTLGYSITDANALAKVSNAIYPMLFIHGLDDDVVPSSMVFDLYNVCPTEKQMFFVKDTGHADCITNSYDAYLETIKEFLDENM